MCEPTTIIAGATLALGAMSAYNQYQQGKYESSVAKQNAQVAEAQADDAINRGNIEADRRRSQMRQQLGTQAATMAASGGDLSSGSSLDIFGDTAQFGQLDALTTVNNAQREAYGLQVQSANYKNQAKSARAQGNAGAMTTLLTAPINAYGAYSALGGSWNPFKTSVSAGGGSTPMLSGGINSNSQFKIGGY